MAWSFPAGSLSLFCKSWTGSNRAHFPKHNVCILYHFSFFFLDLHSCFSYFSSWLQPEFVDFFFPDLGENRKTTCYNVSHKWKQKFCSPNIIVRLIGFSKFHAQVVNSTEMHFIILVLVCFASKFGIEIEFWYLCAPFGVLFQSFRIFFFQEIFVSIDSKSIIRQNILKLFLFGS